MMYCHMVMEVIQKAAPAMAMVISPGTHPKTLKIYRISVAINGLATRAHLRKGPCLSHNGKADLVSGEQPRSLLPCHGSELDFMLMI